MRGGRRLWLRILGGLVALAMIAVLGAYWWVRPLLRTGTGYAAHNACALATIAHRTPLTADLPPNPLVPYLRVAPDAGGYWASVLGVGGGPHAGGVDGAETTGDWLPELGGEGIVVPVHPATSRAMPITTTVTYLLCTQAM